VDKISAHPIKDPTRLVLQQLISTTGGRFPRAWLEPPCASHSGVSRLMGQHYCSSHRRPFAIPANVFGGKSNRSPRSRRLPFQSTRECYVFSNSTCWEWKSPPANGIYETPGGDGA